MRTDDARGGGALFTAFLMGAMTGAALALMWAPAAGGDTRRYVAARARNGREKAATAARRGRELLQRQRESVKEAIDRGREAFAQAREQEQV